MKGSDLIFMEHLEEQRIRVEDIALKELSNYKDTEKPKIHLGGFSQGSAVCIQTLLNKKVVLESMICMCGTYVHQQDQKDLDKLKTRVLLINSLNDTILPAILAKLAAGRLEEYGLKFEHKFLADQPHEFNEKLQREACDFYSAILICTGFWGFGSNT